MFLIYSGLPIIPLARGGETLLVIPVSPVLTLDETSLPEFGDSLAVVIYFLGDLARLFSTCRDILALDMGLLLPVRYLLEEILSGESISSSCNVTLYLKSAKCYFADGLVYMEFLG